MLETTNEMEKYIKWADTLFDLILSEVQKNGFASKITEENISRWKQLVREHEFIYEKNG